MNEQYTEWPVVDRAVGASTSVVLARETPFHIGNLLIEPALRRVTHPNARSEALEPLVMQVLVVLARAEGAVVTRDELVERCWGGRIVGDDSISRVIFRLRKFAADFGGGAFTIETTARVGFRLIGAPLTPAALPPSKPIAAQFGWWRVRRGRILAMVTAAVIAIGAPIAFNSTRVSPPLSIAVLPFRALDAESEYLASGFSDEVLAELARQPQLRIVGRTSASALARRGADARNIGKALDVRYLLEGSVGTGGDHLKVTVALIDTGNGLQVWSRRYDDANANLFALHDKVARDVSERLELRFAASADRDHLETSPEIYSLYLLARGMLHTREPEKILTAKHILERVVRLDSAYAPGWSALAAATAFTEVRQNVYAPDPNPRALGFAERAIALAPDFADGHAAKGLALNFRAGALRSLQHAFRLNPRDPQIRYWLSTALHQELRFAEQLDHLLVVARDDPFWRNSALASASLTEFGRRDEALSLERRVANDDPDPAGRAGAMARIAAYSGDFSGAVAWQLRATRLTGNSARGNREYGLELLLSRLGIDPGMFDLPETIAPLTQQMRLGEAPPLAALGPFESWKASRFDAAPWVLLRRGRNADLVGLWDRDYRRVLEPAESGIEPDVRLMLLPEFALALRAVGRKADAESALAAAAAIVSKARPHGPLPASFSYFASRVEAQRGERNTAIAHLLRARDLLWFDQYSSATFEMIRWPDQDPALRPIIDDRRVAAFAKAIAAQRDRERSETVALLKRSANS